MLLKQHENRQIVPVKTRLGTLLARTMARIAACAAVAALPSCVVPAPVDEGVQDVQPIVMINKKKLKPDLLEAVVISRASEDGQEFNARSSLATAGGVTTLNYYWYYDFEQTDGGNLDKYSICGNQDVCTIFPCERAKYLQDTHQLMLVVANKPRNDKPQDPHDFPEGTAFDMAVWTLQLGDECKSP